MKHKKMTLSALLLLGLTTAGIKAQTINVKQNNGTQTAYTLGDVSKMTFAGGNVTITKNNKSGDIFALSGLRYLNFASVGTDVKKPLTAKKPNLVFYPNPANNDLNIDLTGLESLQGVLTILNFDGKILLTQSTADNGVQTLNISHLPTGIYLCRYSSSNEVKTVKFIKY